MTTRLLVPLDGSDKDQRAIQVADAFATLVGGSIRMVRVLETPATHVSTGLAMLGAVPASTPGRQVGIEQDFGELAHRMLQGGQREVTWEVVDAVDVASELVTLAERDADVVIMATRAPGTVERAFLGSVADIVVRKTTRPVVVVPPHVRYAKDARISFARALVPLDGSRLARAALVRLRDSVAAGKLEYVLMQAVRAERTGGHAMPDQLPVDDTAPMATGITHVQAEQAEAHLQEFAATLREQGDRADVRVVESTDPSAAILAAIRSELVDLIVMSTHGESGVRRALHGSVANGVARGSEVPLFLVTPMSAKVSRPRP